MTFVNVAMLLGLAGAAIPVLIHLMGRRQPRRIEFPAIQFLASKLEVNRRRLNIQRWILLAMRTVLIAMVVLALAQPRISGSHGAAWVSVGGLWTFALIAAGLAWLASKTKKSKTLIYGLFIVSLLGLLGGAGWATLIMRSENGPIRNAAAEAAVAIVLDNSVRLEFREANKSRFAAAKELVGWLLDQFPPGSRIAILDRTARPANFALDNEAARRTLESTETVSIEQPLDRQIEAAVRLVRSSELKNRAVYVVTDLSANGWDADNAVRLKDLLAEEPKVAVQIVDLGGDSTDNWRIQNLKLPSLPLAAGVPGQLSVDVIGPVGDAKLETQIELQLYASTLPVYRAGVLDVPALEAKDRQTVRAGSDVTVLLDLPPLESGTYRGWIRIDTGDPLSIDDQVPWVVEVSKAPKVAVVGSMQTERQAMSLVFADPSNPANEFEVKNVDEAELAKLNLTQFAAAVWLDPPSLSGPVAAWIQSGGQVIIALGEQWKSGRESNGELPFKTLRQWRVPEPGTYLDLAQPDFPPLDDLADASVPWPNYPVKIYWQVEPNEGVVSPIRYAGTGHSAMLDFAWREGRVLLLTTPVPGLSPELREWNKLLSGGDAWPTWLLLRQSLGYLARPDTGTLNVLVGVPVTIPQTSSDPKRYQLISPLSTAAPIEPSGTSLVPGAPLDVGHYWLLGGKQPRGYAARLRDDQTDLRRLPPTLLQTWLGGDQFSLARSQDEVRWEESNAGGGQPLYAQAMLAAVIIWLLEHTLANRFYKRGI